MSVIRSRVDVVSKHKMRITPGLQRTNVKEMGGGYMPWNLSATGIFSHIAPAAVLERRRHQGMSFDLG
jgi:hypothetical protein